MAGETDSEDEAEKKPLSKKKQRKLNRLTVAELKQLVSKPEVVEWTDVSAADPRLLLHLKCYRNTIPIPAHWSAKRDYLQGKRGIEKPPFQLPSYIADTGIATQRDAIKEKEANMSLKAKTRERVQPKMGKIDIDYQKLHDAFFKFQTKPPLTSFGEMYYEGKEFETSLKEKRPGDLSPELVEALSIPPLAPPPWLISMQRFGPPPSYPTLRIPGLNAPIPEGCVSMITFLDHSLTYLTATAHSGAFIPVDGENRHWTSTTVHYTAMCLVSCQRRTTRQCVYFDLSIVVIYAKCSGRWENRSIRTCGENLSPRKVC